MSAERRANLGRLLRPRHVAFVGGRSAEAAMTQCLGAGFQGPVWPVNPRRRAMAGRACFPSIGDLPAPPDATFIAVPAPETVRVVEELAAAGAGGCVCYAAGFAESGAEGEALQRRLVDVAGDLAVVGPNCYGVINYLDGVTLWRDEHGGDRVMRGVALITQSGNVGINLTMQQRSVPLATVVSLGNQAAMGIGEVVDGLLDDERISVIGLFLEGLDDAGVFAAAALRAKRAGVPLVAVKSGRSEIGSRVALSHTSSLTGSDAAYGAFFHRLSVIRADTLSALLETCKLLHVTGPLASPRILTLSCSGGEASLLADLADGLGLEFPMLRPEQRRALRALLPDFVNVANPFDYNTSFWGDARTAEACFRLALAGDADLGLLLIDFPTEGLDDESYRAQLEGFVAAHRGTRTPTAVASCLPESMPVPVRERLMAEGIAPLQGLEDALGAVRAAAWYAEQPLRPPPWTGAEPEPGSARALDEAESKRMLAEHGLDVPEGRCVEPANAVAAADALGYPVAVKVLDPKFAHKTEVGAVVLGCASAGSVESAVRDIAAALEARGLALRRVLVERMAPPAVAELIVGITREPPFGPVLVVGSGGILVELVGDACSLLLPSTDAEIESALRGLRAMRLIQGFRGGPPGDRPAAVAAIAAIARFAEAHADRIFELDVNPLLVLPEGHGAVAVDALIRMAP